MQNKRHKLPKKGRTFFFLQDKCETLDIWGKRIKIHKGYLTFSLNDNGKTWIGFQGFSKEVLWTKGLEISPLNFIKNRRLKG